MGGTACNCNGNKPGLNGGNGGDTQAGRLTISVVGPRTVILAPNRDVQLKFLVTLGSGETGTPVSGMRIDFSKTGLPDVLVGSDYLMSEADGTVTVKVRAGSQNGQATITAAAEGLESASVIVDVNGKYAGNLVVRSGYSGPIKIARLEVRLHDGRIPCAATWKTTAPNGLPATVQTLTVPNTATDARFNNLTEKTKYIATVVGINAVNRPVAYGCGGPEEVVGGRDKILNVQLDTLEPIVMGKYEFGQVMEPLEFMDKNSTTYLVLDNILRFLSNPIAFALQGAQTSPGNYAGGCNIFPAGSSRNTCVALGTQLVEPLIYQLLRLDNSGTAENVYNAIKEVATQVRKIRVGGVLDIKTHDPATGNITAELKFDKWNLVWTWECPPTGTDACCGHRIFNGGDIGVQPFSAVIKLPNGTETSTFAGHLTKVTGQTDLAYDATFDETYLSLVYGQVALALIEGVLLPAILTDTTRYPRDPQGRVRVSSLLSGLLNCGSLSPGSSERIACDAVSAAAGALTTQLAGALNTSGSEEWNLKQQIAARFTDNDNDLQTDTLSGTFTFKATGAGATVQQKDGALNALFTTTPCTGDASCTAGLACRFARSPVDSCKSSNYCGVPTGPKQVYEACSVDDECSSGTCMINPPLNVTVSHTNKCFKACAQDVDCGGQGHCDQDGYISQPVTLTPDPYTNNNTVTGTCVP
ncbi:MAG: hypothetical protein IT381_13160 [Deltaproteobacteria bacterium]|nr:hypothetical protein [Deltaproteobacteria bacterium]